MKNYFSLLVIVLLSSAALAQTEFEGEVSGEWDTEGSPYVQVGAANVPQNQTLTIQPGVEVHLHRQQEFIIHGILNAVGTEEDTIRFINPEGEIAGTMRLTSTQDTSIFQYCRFDSLQNAVRADQDTRFIVMNSLFYDNYRHFVSRCHWTEIRSNTFIGLDRNPSYRMLFDTEFHQYRRTGAVRFIDNLLLSFSSISISCATVLIEGNTVPDADRLSCGVMYFETPRFTARWNTGLSFATTYLNFGLIEGLLEDNDSFSVSAYQSGRWRLTIRRNRGPGISLDAGTSAEVHDNEFENAIYLNNRSGMRARKNVMRGLIMTEGNNFADLDGNTIWRDKESPNSPLNPPISCSLPREGQDTIILRNNLIISIYGSEYGIAPNSAISGLGSNIFWGVERAYERDNLLPNDRIIDPRVRGRYQYFGLYRAGHYFSNYDTRLRPDSPCIDAGHPDSPRDPDGTRADIGYYYYDQEEGAPPALTDLRWDYYIGWGERFRYVARAVDEGEELSLGFEGLPDWLEIEGNDDHPGRDLVYDTLAVSGIVPEDQEDFVFNVIARDAAEREDTLSVRVMVYPYRVLTGIVRGELDVRQSPFIVADTAWVPAGDSLVIPPGTHLYFDNRNDELANRSKSMLMVQGTLKAVGTEEDSITIGGMDTIQFNTGLFFFENQESNHEFRHCIFSGLRIVTQTKRNNISYSNTFSNPERSNILIARGTQIPFQFIENKGRATLIASGTGEITRNVMPNSSIGTPYADSILIFENDIAGISTVSGGSNIYIFNNKMGQVYFSGEITHNINVYNNVIIGSEENIYLAYTEANIHNNILLNGNRYGLYITPYDYEILLFNNVIINTPTGVHFYRPDYANMLQVRNNVFLNLDTLLSMRSGNTNSLQYNSFYNIGFLSNDSNYTGNLTQINANGDSVDAFYNIYLDPRLANPDTLDFRLYADSPLINAGNPDSAFNDIDGSINDIGLYGGPYGSEPAYLDPDEVISFVGPPREFRVGDAYPNPFNVTTNISVEIPFRGNLTLSLFDIQGRQVARNVITELSAGVHRLPLSDFLATDLGKLNSGVYFLVLEYQQKRVSKKIVLIR